MAETELGDYLITPMTKIWFKLEYVYYVFKTFKIGF